MSMVAVDLFAALPGGKDRRARAQFGLAHRAKKQLGQVLRGEPVQDRLRGLGPRGSGDDVGIEQDDGLVHENDGGWRIGPRAGSSNSTPPMAAKRA